VSLKQVFSPSKLHLQDEINIFLLASHPHAVQGAFGMSKRTESKKKKSFNTRELDFAFFYLLHHAPHLRCVCAWSLAWFQMSLFDFSAIKKDSKDFQTNTSAGAANKTQDEIPRDFSSFLLRFDSKAE
jgi:hypothetical protein